MFDSGRNGYRCAPYVVNLDGKASLAALNLADGGLLAHLAAFQIDRLLLRDDYVMLFDNVYPQWRRQFSPSPPWRTAVRSSLASIRSGARRIG